MPAMLSRVIASQTETGGLRVLVVDDEQSITDAVATALRYEGFETREAATGRLAEKAIDEFRPDLVVLGGMLPALAGFSIARRLRGRCERRRDLRELPPQEARSAGAAPDPDDPPRRLRPPRTRGLVPLPAIVRAPLAEHEAAVRRPQSARYDCISSLPASLLGDLVQSPETRDHYW